MNLYTITRAYLDFIGVITEKISSYNYCLLYPSYEGGSISPEQETKLLIFKPILMKTLTLFTIALLLFISAYNSQKKVTETNKIVSKIDYGKIWTYSPLRD